METEHGRNNKCAVCAYEFFGTGIIQLVIQMAKPMGPIYHLPAIYFAILAMIVVTGPVSGGHVNPAITVGVLFGFVSVGKFWQNFFFAVAIILSQIGGAIFATLIVYLFLERDDKTRTHYPEINILCPP